jgi:5-hydroxyisourate hydrolase
MSAITTHVLDTARGRAAEGIPVRLEHQRGGEWQAVGNGHTDRDGRLRSLSPDGAPLAPGIYRLTFQTGNYFTSQGARTFYPEVVVIFETAPGETHYHVPLLISPFGYTTYRGT